MRTLREWLQQRKRAKEARRRIETAARAHARRSMYCALCPAPLGPEEMNLGYCNTCWALVDENSDGVRPLGMPQ